MVMCAVKCMLWALLWSGLPVLLNLGPRLSAYPAILLVTLFAGHVLHGLGLRLPDVVLTWPVQPLQQHHDRCSIKNKPHAEH